MLLLSLENCGFSDTSMNRRWIRPRGDGRIYFPYFDFSMESSIPDARGCFSGDDEGPSPISFEVDYGVSQIERPRAHSKLLVQQKHRPSAVYEPLHEGELLDVGKLVDRVIGTFPLLVV